MNGRGRAVSPSPIHILNGVKDTIADAPAPDELTGRRTLQVTPEEADLVLKHRQALLRRDPLVLEQMPAGENGIQTPRRLEWQPTPISQLSTEGDNVPWLWGGYIARGHKTSFTGLWKSGKTTLLKYLLKSMDGSATEFCGQPVTQTKVLVVSEESKRLWAGRRDEVGLGDNVHLINLPFVGRPRQPEWIAFVSYLAELQAQYGYDLIVIDSMHNLWGVTDENNNAEVLAYLTPLNMLTEQDAAVLLLAHPNKGDAGEGRATRGGGAWGGFVDIILEMRRHNAEDSNDTRRVLKAYSRWDETPAEMVIELDKENGQYRAVGTKSDARASDRMAVYMELLPTTDLGLTPEEIREAWPTSGIPRSSVKTIARDLDQAVTDCKVRCIGAGKRGDPKRYSIPDTIGT
jgi:hypothetical protein